MKTQNVLNDNRQLPSPALSCSPPRGAGRNVNVNRIVKINRASMEENMSTKGNLRIAIWMLSCFIVFFITATSAVYAATWNVQDDFSTASNPNGPYSYGWMPTLGGKFSVYDFIESAACGCGGPSTGTVWHMSGRSIATGPGIGKVNGSSACCGIEPGELTLHPGPSGEFSVIRWISPVTGTITINGYFGAGDSGIMSYFIYKDGTTPLFTVHGSGGDGPFSLVEYVSVGSTIDFVVGEGYGWGSTPLHAEITSDDDPEPTVTITAPDAIACEAGRSTGVFKISRNGGTSEPLMVKYRVTGTAKAASDYDKLAGAVLIPAGKTFATVLVKPKADKLKESDETVILTLQGDDDYQVGTPSSATVTIVDNHPNN
jgi:hypothetical protein